eukprot:scaffold662_cov248-Pinguiococcus_pyrenoidosus.AAC.4
MCPQTQTFGPSLTLSASAVEGVAGSQSLVSDLRMEEPALCPLYVRSKSPFGGACVANTSQLAGTSACR